MDNLEDLHTDWINICFHHYGSLGPEMGTLKASLNYPLPPTQTPTQ